MIVPNTCRYDQILFRSRVLPSLVLLAESNRARSQALSIELLSSNRASLSSRILRHSRVSVNLRLVVLERSIGDRADLASLLLVQCGMLRWQHGAHGADDRAGSIGDGFFVVGILESRALGCVPSVSTFGGYWGAGVAVDDVVVVLDLGVSDGAAGLGVV